MGSALIAGETSLAYDEIFTLTYVTGRSVGIGSYLVRLGQRVIQKASQPIILTGINALNKILGRDVYVSNLQIGGPQIMSSNGVSHIIVKDDLEGVYEIIRWLSYVPVNRNECLPILLSKKTDCSDSVYQFCDGDDPRLLLIGNKNKDGKWLSGLLDYESFQETLSGWAPSVICGRGRIGGIPIAVIMTETRTTSIKIPSDPGNLTSESQLVQYAGHVWYPDSAFKTSQMIRDADREGLPLFIIANWRGFSGGQRDLYDGILQAGSLIVDALRNYRQPVFVYLPPGGELRGGSWVVLDTAINPEKIEMYADPTARAGIMEPVGIVNVKYRQNQLIEAMQRLDPQLQRTLSKDKILEENRIKELTGVFNQVAIHFADLHDRPGRMLAVGAIKAIVPWQEARTTFYRRLCERLGIAASKLV